MQVMVTRLHSDMPIVLSEYPLLPDHALHMEGEALWIEGIGWLGQYYNYYDTLWEKGVPYFCRDYYLNQLEAALESGVCHKELRDSFQR